jgi:hypothetical protein
VSIEVQGEDFLYISGNCPEESIDLSIATQRFEVNQTAHLLHVSIFHSYMEKKSNIRATNTWLFFFQVVALFN